MKSAISKKSPKSAPTANIEGPAGPEAAKKPESTIRVVKSGVCPSLSGKSKLTYEVGCNEKSEVHLRVVGNSNPGCYNTDWVQLRAIRAALDKVPKSEPVTADALMPLFRGMSTNTGFFTFAVLRQEGLVKPSEKKKRCYDRAEPEAFDAVVKALAEGKGAPVADAKSKKVKSAKVAPAKSPSVSKKK